MKNVDEANRLHPPESNGGGGGGGEEQEELEEEKRKSGGHQVPIREKTMAEIKSEERRKRLEQEAKKKAEEAMAAIDELNKESAHTEELKRKRLGEARRFGTDKPINETPYSLKEFSSYIEAGREYFNRFTKK